MSNTKKMSKEQAHDLMYFLWQQGYLKSNVSEEHSDYDYIIELISDGKITSKFINDLLYKSY